jgi:hypothetical protein
LASHAAADARHRDPVTQFTLALAVQNLAWVFSAAGAGYDGALRLPSDFMIIGS